MIEAWENQHNCEGRCADCPGTEAPYPLGGLGSLQSDIMVVAMQPNYNVDDDSITEDMVWVDAHRKLKADRAQSMNPLWKHLTNIGVAEGCAPEELYFTNLAKCTTDDSSWSERYDHCSSYFTQELYEVSPDLVLAHGKKVIKALLSLFELEWSGKVGDVHGEVFEHQIADIGCLYHWGYAMRNNTMDEYNDVTYEMVKNR